MSQYAKSGVNIGAKMALIDQIKAAVQATHGPEVLAGVGSFGGLFQLTPEMILVASTDGVGTKTMLAAQAGRYRGLGLDIVNHCVNDILCQGARPLFFMDYVASSQLDPAQIAEVIEGMAEACKAAGCALLGGETAEMPGVYQPGQFDLVGTIIGIVNQADKLPSPDIEPGDVLFGLPSSGPHTNGYSLIRRVFDGIPLDTAVEDVGVLSDALLAPHRSYLAEITRLRQTILIKGLAHITGGGFLDNIPRALPEGLGVEIRRETWTVPPLFKLIQQRGAVDEDEMYHVFNMGIGMVMIVDQQIAGSEGAQALAPYSKIGQVVAQRGVHLR